MNLFKIAFGCLSACMFISGSTVREKEVNETVSGVETETWNQNYYTTSYRKYISESQDGFYAAIEGFLYYIDKNTLSAIVLCPNPNCMHKNDECNAYFSQVNSQIIYYKGSIYGFEDRWGMGSYDLIKVAGDGISREKITTVNNLEGNNFLIDRDIIYYTVLDDEERVSIEAYNLQTKKKTSVYTSLLGQPMISCIYIYNDQMYFTETGVNSEEEYYTQFVCCDLENQEEMIIMPNETWIQMDGSVHVLGSDQKYLYIMANSTEQNYTSIYRYNAEDATTQYYIDIPVGFTVMDQDYIYIATDEKILIYDIEGNPVNEIPMEEEVSSVVFSTVPVSGSESYSFIFRYIALPDENLTRSSILACPKNRIREENLELIPVLEKEADMQF